jgi:hypothetical protein
VSCIYVLFLALFVLSTMFGVSKMAPPSPPPPRVEQEHTVQHQQQQRLPQQQEEQLSSQFWMFLLLGVIISTSSYFVLHAEDDALPPVLRQGRDAALEVLGFSLNAGRKAFRREEARLSRTCSLTLSVEHLSDRNKNTGDPQAGGAATGTRITSGDLLKFTDFAVYDASSLASFVDAEGASAAILALQDLDVSSSLPLLHQATKPILRTHQPPREYTFTAGGGELLPCLTSALNDAAIEIESIVTVYCCASSAFGPLGFTAWGVAPNLDVVVQFGPISRG